MDQHDVHRRWRDRSRAYSPGYYAYYGPDGTSEALREVVDDAVGEDAAVLELGCGCGRHLAHLHDHGYDDLSGIDVNGDATAVMAETYPDLADAGTFHVDTIERVVPGFDDDAFDVVFSVETLQHVHPDGERVFADLVRVAGDLLVTVENEDGADPSTAERSVTRVDGEIPLYHRRWDRVFADLGCVEVASRSLGRDTLRAFRPRSGE